ncbi:nucleotidyltransferase domain-containing protein [Rahnella perminowiae]|uniref:nucleotidyltransferase domain-containing protein n=1 Tax=Rahnella perminowiae TaxID=2816244 RepID=UPI003AF06DC0
MKNTGVTIERIETEIQCIITAGNDIYGIYGFGSFFRFGKGNDIDILVVSDAVSQNLLAIYNSVAEKLWELSAFLGIDIDFTFFTFEEFKKKPLLESDSLHVIYQKDSNKNQR